MTLRMSVNRGRPEVGGPLKVPDWPDADAWIVRSYAGWSVSGPLLLTLSYSGS